MELDWLLGLKLLDLPENIFLTHTRLLKRIVGKYGFDCFCAIYFIRSDRVFYGQVLSDLGVGSQERQIIVHAGLYDLATRVERVEKNETKAV